MVHRGRGHQSASESQTRPRRVFTEAPAQLLPDQRQLHPPEPTGQRELPPLQCHGHRPLDGQRAGNLLQIGLLGRLHLSRPGSSKSVQSCMNLQTLGRPPVSLVCIVSHRRGQDAPKPPPPEGSALIRNSACGGETVDTAVTQRKECLTHTLNVRFGSFYFTSTTIFFLFYFIFYS